MKQKFITWCKTIKTINAFIAFIKNTKAILTVIFATLIYNTAQAPANIIYHDPTDPVAKSENNTINNVNVYFIYKDSLELSEILNENIQVVIE